MMFSSDLELNCRGDICQLEPRGSGWCEGPQADGFFGGSSNQWAVGMFPKSANEAAQACPIIGGGYKYH